MYVDGIDKTKLELGDDKNKTGTIMSYVTNDVSALQSGLVDNIVDMITEGVILVASIVAMIYLDWKLFLFSLCTFPVVILFIDFSNKLLYNIYTK